MRYVLLEVDDEAGSFTGITWAEAFGDDLEDTRKVWYGFPARVIRIADSVEDACADLMPVIERWVECPYCEGSEGYADDDDVWHPCPDCDGEGGHVEDDW